MNATSTTIATLIDDEYESEDNVFGIIMLIMICLIILCIPLSIFISVCCLDGNASDINASDINASDINASGINAYDINASGINAYDINASDMI
jgi:hypothetical protein